jgi:hypothetical protein
VFIFDRVGQNRLENVQHVIDIAGAWRNGYNASNNYPCQTNAFNSVTENEPIDNLTIYPNPSKGPFTLKHSFGNDTGTLRIVALEGKKVYEQEVKGETIHFSQQLENGVYLVVLEIAGQQLRERMVIEH